MPPDCPASFGGDWLSPTDPSYASAISRWAKNAERRAAVVSCPRTPEDVAATIKCARAHGLPLAVRGGGHSTAGASSSAGGVVIDLSVYMRHVRVDTDAKLAYVGGGAVWKDVDEEGMKYGLATVGGTVNHTGVGGLVLGGGFGHLSGEYGFAVDNLHAATIVTASGETVRASAEDNPDLFWAIRGSGCNFGVVTEFQLRMHRQRRTVFAGVVVYPGTVEVLEKVMQVVEGWWRASPERESIIQFLTLGPDGKPACVLALFWNGSEEEGRVHFKPFFDLGPVMDTCTEIPYEQLNGLQNAQVPHGQHYYMKGAFVSAPAFRSASPILSYITSNLDTWKELGVTPTLAFEYIPLGKTMSVPLDTTAYMRAPVVSTLCMMAWRDDDEAERKLEKVRAIANVLVQTLVESDAGVDKGTNTGYGNYLSEEVAADDVTAAVTGEKEKADKSLALFGKHYPRLREIKRKWDPELVWNKWYVVLPATA
ncbi:FAD-binding domain-containing protein [Peniophora sp. CONT]|nr:FAD-binding domain-containing protein [Peniophora sp. CONT]